MGVMWIGWLLSLLLLAVNGDNIELRMPGVQPKVPDTYLCFPMKLTDKIHITGFTPHGNMNTAHHILLYGCGKPGGGETEPWNCGEMASKSDTSKSGPVCGPGSTTKIIYAWAMDAPALTLPKDVGFELGGDNSVQWLVLQVHYKSVKNFLPPNNKKDHSGVTLVTTDKPTPKLAGVYLLGTGGSIPAHSTVYMDAACEFDENTVLHPFAYRSHAHTHGKVNSGYVVKDGPNGREQWIEIGRKSPQLPQMFYNTTTAGVTINRGDRIAARCTMVNNEDRIVKIGATQHDEMCNFYIMYWVANGQLPAQDTCFSSGPPTYYWKYDETLDMSAVPATASQVPGEKAPLMENVQEDDDSDETREAIMSYLLNRFDKPKRYYDDDETDAYYRQYV